MNKFTENKYLYTLIFGVVTAIIGIILFPLFDFFICKFFTHSTFVYSVVKHIVEPTIFGFLMAIVLYFPFNKK